MQAFCLGKEAFPVLKCLAPRLYEYGMLHPMPLVTMPYWFFITPRAPNESEPNQVDHVHAKSEPSDQTCPALPQI